jgi:hypothetical protein
MQKCLIDGCIGWARAIRMFELSQNSAEDKEADAL